MIVSGTLGLGATSAFAFQRYHATADGVALRSGPGTGYALLGRVNNGTPLDVACQVQGGTNVGGNATWDRLTGGQWVADYWTSSPSYNSYAPGLGDCNQAPAPGRTRGQTRPNNAGVAGQCTWGAYEQFKAATGVYPALTGDAKNWANSARATGWTVVSDAQARSIVVFQPGAHGADATSGHVAWVESVEHRADGLYVHILEMNGWKGAGGGPFKYDRQVLKDIPGMSYILAP
ncbi:MAG: CHAP domain-containing protein [Actinomycetota bacterium]|nr:CHAP domain-containing protein [Actinomycetota bacterium]